MNELPRCAECREPIGAGEPLTAQHPDGNVVHSCVGADKTERHEPYGSLMFHRECFAAAVAER